MSRPQTRLVGFTLVIEWPKAVTRNVRGSGAPTTKVNPAGWFREALRRLSPHISHFPIRSADFQSAFSVIASAKPTASRRSRMLAFCAVHEISGLGSDLAVAEADPFVAGQFLQPHRAARADLV